MIETLMAILVLTVGLVSVAALMSQMLGDTAQSRYMSLAAMLASEKLEDLNRYPDTDPLVYVPSGSTTEGSLTADTSQSITSGVVTETVDYWDEVKLSTGSGSISETINGKDALGNTTYTTITHQPDGTITQTTSITAPPAAVGTLAFKRRWVIEKDAPVKGVDRITVSVTLEDQSVQPGVTFQTSMVRP